MLNPDSLQGQAFIDKFVPLLEGLMSLGMSKKQAIKAALTQNFVRDFADTPEWFVSAKLPKGYKWSDGEKYSIKGGHRADSETYTFLPIDGDLYINGLYRRAVFYAHDEEGELQRYKAPKEIRGRVVVIKNWQEMNAHHVLQRLRDECTPFFDNSLLKFWRKNGGETGLMEPILRGGRK